MKPLRLSALAILLSFGLTGCEEGRRTPDRVTVTFVNAAPSFSSVDFLREEISAAELGFRDSSSATFGIDVYDMHLEVTPAGGETQRLVSFSLELAANTNYTIVALEVGGQLQHRLITSADSDGTNIESSLLHLSPVVPEVDVYVIAPGTDVAGSSPIATIAFSQEIGAVSLPPGATQIVLTEASNPTAILLASTTINLPTGGSSLLIAIVDDAGQGFANVAVLLAGTLNASLVDQNLDASVRVINAISDRSSLDFGIDGNLTPPLLPSVGFGTISDYMSIDPGTITLTGTPAGNPSVTEVELELQASAGRFLTVFVANDPGATTAVQTENDLRPIAGEAKLSVYNGSNLFQLVDVFVVTPGTDISNKGASFAAATTGVGIANSVFAAGTYELTVQDTLNRTILAGPTTITLNDSGYYGLLISDNVGGSTVDITQFDDF